MLAVAVRETGLIFLFKRLDAPFDKLPIAEETIAVKCTPSPVSPIIWFVCPGCGGHAYKLYVHPNEVRWRCSRCTGLPPRSNQLSKKQRLARRLKKINDLLGVPHWLPPEQIRIPAGMQWVDFYRLMKDRAALRAAGVIENQDIIESAQADRKRREREQERKDNRIRNGVLYLDKP
jgi:hypothetical protein